jgi:splicing factor 1
LGIPTNAENRSPSPEPEYDTMGKRLNTRDARVRKKLEEERHKLIIDMIKINPEYKPPFDYKYLIGVKSKKITCVIFFFCYRVPATKIVDKVFIPQDDNPDINFVGLLIGPRGNTLKELEKEVSLFSILTTPVSTLN